MRAGARDRTSSGRSPGPASGPRSTLRGMEVPAGAVESETGFTWLADGIYVFKNKGVGSTAGTMQRSLTRHRELFGDVRRPVLIDATLLPSAEYGSWIQFVKQLHSVATACVILTSDATNLPGLGVYPQQIDRMLIPFRAFEETELEDALAFLRRYIDPEESDA